MVGVFIDCDCKIDFNCDCFLGMIFLVIYQFFFFVFKRKTCVRKVKRKIKVLFVNIGLCKGESNGLGVRQFIIW